MLIISNYLSLNEQVVVLGGNYWCQLDQVCLLVTGNYTNAYTSVIMQDGQNLY